MTVVKKWSGDGLAAGTLTTSSAGTGDSAFNVVDAGFTVDNTGDVAPRIKLADGTGQAQIEWSVGSDPTYLANYAVRFYFSVSTETGAIARGYGSAGGSLWRIDWNSSGLIRLLPAGTGTTWAATEHLPLDTRLRCELTVDSAGNATIAIYQGDATTQLMGGSGNVGAGTLATAAFGRTTGAATSNGTYLDDLAVADSATLIGPATVAPASVRPVSVTNTGGYTNVGGAASLTAALADESDATYAESPAGPTGTQLTATFGAIGTGPITVKVRHQASAASPAVSRLYELLDGDGATVVTSRTVTLPTAMTDYQFTTNSTETAAITDRSALSVRVTDTSA